MFVISDIILDFVQNTVHSCGGEGSRTPVQTMINNTIYTAYRVKLGLSNPPLYLI